MNADYDTDTKMLFLGFWTCVHYLSILNGRQFFRNWILFPFLRKASVSQKNKTAIIKVRFMPPGGGGGIVTWQEQVIPNIIPENYISVSRGLLEICASICSRKLWMMAKESGNI